MQVHHFQQTCPTYLFPSYPKTTMTHLFFLSLCNTPTPHVCSPPNIHTHRYKQIHKLQTISSLLKSIKFGEKREKGIISKSMDQFMKCKNILLCTGEINHLLLLKLARTREFQNYNEPRERGRKWVKREKGREK